MPSLGLGLGVRGMQPALMARYSLGGKAPAVIADPVAGVYGLGGRPVGFDNLFTFSRLSAAWKLNALGHWVKVLAGEPRMGHHVSKDGQLVPAGIAVCSEVRTQFLPYASSPATNWGSPNSNTNAVADGFTRVTSDGTASFPRAEKSTNITAPGTYTAQAEVREGSSGEIFLRVSGVDIGPQLGTSSVYKFDFSDQTFVKIGGADATQTYVEEREPGVFRIAFSFTAASVAWVNIYPAWADDTAGLSAEFRHPMLSEGGLPGDFIPNDTGAQVTTASEGLQLDPVKLAKAVGVFGPELPLNTAGSATWDDETKTATYADAPYGAISTGITDGEMLLVSGNLSGGINAELKNNDGDTYPLIHKGDGNFEALVVGINGFGLRMYTNYSGAYVAATISNLRVRKVTIPDALTFVMKGTTSYADEGLNPQVRMMLWQADSSNLIRLQLNTVDARTGQFIAFTQKDGVANSALSASDAYSPGMEVPFSVAAVLTATEIEGFYNGVSTGKVAHGGLPNLMAAPMEFFSPGTGTITEFCLWPEALTSSTLLEATA